MSTEETEKLILVSVRYLCDIVGTILIVLTIFLTSYAMAHSWYFTGISICIVGILVLFAASHAVYTKTKTIREEGYTEKEECTSTENITNP